MAKEVTSAAVIELFQKALKGKWGYIWGTAGIEWTEARQKAIEKTTDADRAQARKYGSKWIGHKVADCSGLFSWAYNQLGGYMYHGSHSMYTKYCVDHGELKKGKRTDGKPLKPGTAVFVWNGERYSHVGLYIGNNTVIEAMSTLNGVTTSKVTSGKWTHWGELKDMRFTDATVTEPAKEPAKTTYKAIRRGSKGETVKIAQRMLEEKGYSVGSAGIDGDFGKATEAAVKAFQKANGLTQDGVIGPKTWEKLAYYSAKVYIVTITVNTEEEAKRLCEIYKNSNYKEMT